MQTAARGKMNTKRYLWCEKTEAEYMEIKAKIEQRRVEMLTLDNHQKLDWPAKNQELLSWLDRSHQYIEGYRAGPGIDEEWDKVCDKAHQGWQDLKNEVNLLIDLSSFPG